MIYAQEKYGHKDAESVAVIKNLYRDMKIEVCGETTITVYAGLNALNRLDF